MKKKYNLSTDNINGYKFLDTFRLEKLVDEIRDFQEKKIKSLKPSENLFLGVLSYVSSDLGKWVIFFPKDLQKSLKTLYRYLFIYNVVERKLTNGEETIIVYDFLLLDTDNHITLVVEQSTQKGKIFADNNKSIIDEYLNKGFIELIKKEPIEEIEITE